MKLAPIALVLVVLPQAGWAAEPNTPAVPAAVRALVGCWTGEGEVMKKPVTITAEAQPIAEDALLVLDAHSRAVADAADRYAAHLVFGGGGKPSETQAGAISGFWSDSFGGAYTAVGKGEATPGGFFSGFGAPGFRFSVHAAASSAGLIASAADLRPCHRTQRKKISIPSRPIIASQT